ncbi:hypothetical protein FRC18_005836 [Serendipita sp. 400]|nr:hypothetical protein FRC18_005836 [Serendipita sp. 400]
MSSEQPGEPSLAYKYQAPFSYVAATTVEGQEVIQHQPAAATALEEPAAKTTEPAPEEPQNQFTKEFTEKDWEGVKFLRSKLVDIAKEVESDSLTLWGVELSSTKPTAKSSVVLVKFVRARQDLFTV